MELTEHSISRSVTDFLTNPRPITVALYFKPVDAPKLWDLATRHHSFDGDELSMFARAARATERGLPIVFECSVVAQLEEVKAFFPLHGIEAPRIQELPDAPALLR